MGKLMLLIPNLLLKNFNNILIFTFCEYNLHKISYQKNEGRHHQKIFLLVNSELESKITLICNFLSEKNFYERFSKFLLEKIKIIGQLLINFFIILLKNFGT